MLVLLLCTTFLFSVCLYCNSIDDPCTGSAKKIKHRNKTKKGGWFSGVVSTLATVFQGSYLILGSLIVIAFPALVSVASGNPAVFQDKYQFLPLMVYSTYCAIGNIYIFSNVYWSYVIKV